ncbi:MAG TPA: hypothetical protein VG253_25200 [Streptosporangiaceae bacterium]|nr:hypothetical protein [Streptosporangiaceae bacterium]
MADSRDDLDTWLSEGVQPLPPPPGTFELIRKRARRRKVTRALLAGAGAAAAIAFIATVPRLAISGLHTSPGHAASGLPAGHLQSAGAARARARQHHTPGPATPTPSPPPSGPPPAPPNFAAASVTFIGTQTGWVMGQAGVPGHCGPPSATICTSIARTTDGGQTWSGVRAPVAGAPRGASGISQIRFLNTSDGWAFGPQLYATHNGGRKWARINTGGLRVTALETSGARVFAIWARCSGGGAFAAHCTDFTVYSAPAGGNQWTPVAGAASSTQAGALGSAQLVLTGTRAYLLAPGGQLSSGAVDGSAWQPAGPGPSAAACDTGAAQPDGQPSGELLAVTGSGTLVLTCGASSPALYTSGDGGASWQQAGKVPGSAVAAVSGSPAGSIVVATRAGIEVSADGGAHWRAGKLPLPPGGFSYVGMTTSQQGVAVPADPSVHAIWLTYDGGKIWQKSPIP